jgi:RHS repeat-associated protein
MRLPWAGGQVTLVFDGQGRLLHRYLYGPQTDQVLADERFDPVNPGPGSQLFWLLADAEGTVRDVIDTWGNSVNHVRYDAFGVITGADHLSALPGFTYAGREWDGVSGLYYERARWYDPGIGRFVSADPLGLAAGTNVYVYAGNQPVTRTDPSGLSWFSDGVNAVADWAAGGVASRLDSWTGGYSTAFLVSPTTGMVVDGTARALTGFADGLFFGLPSRGVDLIWGDFTARNHEGTAYWVGVALGVGTAFLAGYGAGETAELMAAGAEVRFLARASLAYTEVATAYFAAHSAYTLVFDTANFGVWDAIALMPAVGFAFRRFLLPRALRLIAPNRGGSLAVNVVERGRTHRVVQLSDNFEIIGRADDLGFYGVRNSAGGEVWVSTRDVSLGEIQYLANQRLQERVQGMVYVIGGAHGTELGHLAGFNDPVVRGMGRMLENPWRITFVDIQNTPYSTLVDILNSPERIVCGWCWSERSVSVIRYLK